MIRNEMKKSKHSQTAVWLGLLLLAVLSACRHVQDKDGGRIVGNEPIFQNFEYVGKDEIYVENPLPEDRKSTRLNSSHVKISYAVFCLKKKKNNRTKCSTSSGQRRCSRPIEHVSYPIKLQEAHETNRYADGSRPTVSFIKNAVICSVLF